MIASGMMNDAQTVVGPSKPRRLHSAGITIQVFGMTETGTGSVTLAVEVSNVDVPSSDHEWFAMESVSLTFGKDGATTGVEVNGAWLWMRTNIQKIAGKGAKVTAVMGGPM